MFLSFCFALKKQTQDILVDASITGMMYARKTHQNSNQKINTQKALTLPLKTGKWKYTDMFQVKMCKVYMHHF